MSEKTATISSRTTIPLFAALAAMITGITAYGGVLLFVAAISTKADLAQAKNMDQDREIARLHEDLKSIANELGETKGAATRSEAMLNILVGNKK